MNTLSSYRLLPTKSKGVRIGASSRPDAYVDLVVGEMLPAVVQQGVARFCDVFCEPGVFTVEQSRRVRSNP